MNPKPLRSIALLVLALWAGSALAASDADPEATRAATAKLINLLVEQGVLTREKAEALLNDLNKPAAPVVRVPYMPENMRKALKDEVQLDLANQAAREGWAKPGSVPEWVRGLEWDGDLRTRFQYDNFAPDNAIDIVDPNATNSAKAFRFFDYRQDRSRMRVRARAGLTTHTDPDWSAGIRLTTSNTTDPISSNQTEGNFNARYTVGLDRAYLRYRPVEELNIVAGRFGNPWFFTDLVWANDLSFDGLAMQWTPALSGTVRGFATVAAMPIQEFAQTGSDRWLYGMQLGAGRAATAKTFGAKLGLAYYHFTHMDGQVNPVDQTTNDYTALPFYQKGNTLYNIARSSPPPPGTAAPVLLALASEYHLVNITGQADFAVGDKRLVFLADYVRNIGYDKDLVNSRVGELEAATGGYQIRVSYGTPEVKRLHDWQVWAGYKRLEADAVVDAFTDSDFHLGGTDARGYLLGASYGVGKNVWASLRYFSADAISRPDIAIDVMQVELNLRF